MALTPKQWADWKYDAGGAPWTHWRPLSVEVIRTEVPAGPGAYVLGLPDERPLGRLLGQDPHGILDIGESAGLRQRLGDLLRCAGQAGERGHMAGWRLGSAGLLARLGIPVAKLRVSWCSAETKDDAYFIEGSLLRDYYELFGELPPLNYKFNWAAWEEGG